MKIRILFLLVGLVLSLVITYGILNIIYIGKVTKDIIMHIMHTCVLSTVDGQYEIRIKVVLFLSLIFEWIVVYKLKNIVDPRQMLFLKVQEDRRFLLF